MMPKSGCQPVSNIPLHGSDVKVGSVAIRKLQRTLKIDWALLPLFTIHMPSIQMEYEDGQWPEN